MSNDASRAIVPLNDKKGKLFVISGPSGAGKSTLCRAIRDRMDVNVSVSATTRKQTAQEVDGKDYYFLSKQEFVEKIDRGEFLEYAQVFDEYYGTLDSPVKEMTDRGESVILEIDVQGAAQVFKRCPEAIGIFVTAPSDDVLRSRITGRSRDNRELIEKRLAKAKWETSQADSMTNFKYRVVNDNLECAIAEITKLLF